MDTKGLSGKKVLLRVDFNVPFKGKRVLGDFKILSHLPTIKLLLKSGARVYLITHLEKDGDIPHLDFLKKKLERVLKEKVGFVRGRIPAKAEKFRERIVLLDNLRLDSGEKNNTPQHARRLARWGDVYVNDAFSVSHRKHSSVVGLPKLLPSRAGILLEREIKNLSRAFHSPKPFLFVLGGKKFITKEPLIDKFIKNADRVFIGGALANTFLRQRGFEVGKSGTEKIKISGAILNHRKILLPADVFVLRSGRKKKINIVEVKKNDNIYDAGPETVKKLAELAYGAKFVLWNGTLGLCEEGFDFGTKAFAKALEKSRAFKIAGGGDTVAALLKYKLEKNFDFISTGGGAMLEFLALGTLPGIEALKKANRASKTAISFRDSSPPCLKHPRG